MQPNSADDEAGRSSTTKGVTMQLQRTNSTTANPSVIELEQTTNATVAQRKHQSREKSFDDSDFGASSDDDDDEVEIERKRMLKARKKRQKHDRTQLPLKFSRDAPLGQLSLLEECRASDGGIFHQIAEFCFVKDLLSLAAASKTTHLMVQNLEWSCQDEHNGDDAVRRLFVNSKYSSTGTANTTTAGDCLNCFKRLCADCNDFQRRYPCRGCESCDKNSDAPICCKSCTMFYESDLFDCVYCNGTFCREGGTCGQGDGGEGIEQCHGDGCEERLCGNCCNVGYASGWEPNCCGICHEARGEKHYCFGCAREYLIDHVGCHCDNRKLCRDHVLVACSGSCGRQLCENCRVEQQCQRCRNWRPYQDPFGFGQCSCPQVRAGVPDRTAWSVVEPRRCVECLFLGADE